MTLEGTLSKWTNVMKGWQNRWFVLESETSLLSYYTVSQLFVVFFFETIRKFTSDKNAFHCANIVFCRYNDMLSVKVSTKMSNH